MHLILSWKYQIPRDAACAGSGVLWERASFCSEHPDLSQQQSQSLNRLLATRCQALSTLKSLSLRGGGWDHTELREVRAGLPWWMLKSSVKHMDN